MDGWPPGRAGKEGRSEGTRCPAGTSSGGRWAARGIGRPFSSFHASGWLRVADAIERAVAAARSPKDGVSGIFKRIPIIPINNFLHPGGTLVR